VVGKFGGGGVANGDTPFDLQTFDITMAEIESVVEPYSIGSNIWREAVTLVCIDHPVIAFTAFNLSAPFRSLSLGENELYCPQLSKLSCCDP
jgi:hypothetical protein